VGRLTRRCTSTSLACEGNHADPHRAVIKAIVMTLSLVKRIGTHHGCSLGHRQISACDADAEANMENIVQRGVV
jgi:hypothetical protein